MLDTPEGGSHLQKYEYEIDDEIQFMYDEQEDFLSDHSKPEDPEMRGGGGAGRVIGDNDIAPREESKQIDQKKKSLKGGPPEKLTHATEE